MTVQSYRLERTGQVFAMTRMYVFKIHKNIIILDIRQKTLFDTYILQ